MEVELKPPTSKPRRFMTFPLPPRSNWSYFGVRSLPVACEPLPRWGLLSWPPSEVTPTESRAHPSCDASGCQATVGHTGWARLNGRGTVRNRSSCVLIVFCAAVVAGVLALTGDQQETVSARSIQSAPGRQPETGNLSAIADGKRIVQVQIRVTRNQRVQVDD